MLYLIGASLMEEGDVPLQRQNCQQFATKQNTLITSSIIITFRAHTANIYTKEFNFKRDNNCSNVAEAPYAENPTVSKL